MRSLFGEVRSLRTTACVGIVGVSVCLLGAPARVAAQDVETLRCQKAVAKAAAKYYKKAHKALAGCRDDAAADTGCDQGRTDGRIAKAEGRIAKQITQRCTGSAQIATLGFPGQCDDPDGAPFTTAELVECLRATHYAQALRAVTIEYPAWPQPLSTLSDVQCQEGIGKVGEKYTRSLSKHRRRCRDKQLRGKIDAGVSCNEDVRQGAPGTGEPKTDKRLLKTIAKLSKRLSGECANNDPEDLGFPGDCVDADGPPFTFADMVECIDLTHNVISRELIDVEYALGNPVATTTTTTSTTTTSTTLDLADLGDLLRPDGDLDGDGYSNATELAQCSNPADPASDPTNDDTQCNNNTIISDTLGPAFHNTDNLTNPQYNAALATTEAQNASDCGAYCASQPDMGSPQACVGVWPWSGAPEHTTYNEGETVEATFPDEDGNTLHATLFLPPDVSCTPTGEPVCDGITDAVTCTSSSGSTYPIVVICDGSLGTQRMYYWAAHRLAANGFIAMTFDVSGQGRSTGSTGDSGISDVGSGFSRDIGAAMNFAVSNDNPVINLVEVDPIAIDNQATNETHVENFNIGLAGHSAGASGAISYQQSTETVLYPVRSRAVAAWSTGDHELTVGNVPIHLQSGDEDGGTFNPPVSGSDGARRHRRFDRLSGDQDLDPGTPDAFVGHDRQIVMIEAASHLTWSQAAWFWVPEWGEEVAYHYTLAWFDKYQKNDIARTMGDVVGNQIQSVDAFNDYAECTPPEANCYTATERIQMGHAHLSDTWCSRYDSGGAADDDMKGTGTCVSE